MYQVVFLVGQQVNSTHQEQLRSEADQYGDIVQEAFIDTYANLTVKSLMLLKWFTQHCDNTQYVMKADDDMYINLVKLYELVQANKKPQLLMGSLICNAIPIKVTSSVLYCTVLYCTVLYLLYCNAIPIKDPYNKWYVPNYMFSARRYPNYLSGNRHRITY